jgi:hypothetical protein
MFLRLVLLLTCIFSLGSSAALAQKPVDEKEVAKVIYRLFNGMERGDSALVKACFSQHVTMATIRRDKDNNQLLQLESSLDGFLRAVGTPHPDVWYEEIWNVKIELDGDFAQAWCDYAFYAGNKFSHCGVDAFHLHRGKEGWKIFHLADTRRDTACIIPKKIQKKHKP